MKTTWRLLDLFTESYGESTMALSPALLRARKEGLSPDTLAVFSFRRPSVVMGYYISPEEDVDLDFCRRNDIAVKRVPTQGLIFGHTGYLMAALYIHRKFLPPEMPEIFRRVNEGIARRIEKQWSVPARHRPLNDLEVEIRGKWKKIGPHSLAFDGEVAVDRVGLTVTPVPMDLASGAIVPPPEKFADKEAKSLAERVGCVEEALGRRVPLWEAKEMMIAALGETFGVDFQREEITEKEEEYRRSFSRLYDNDEWLLAKASRKRFSSLPAGAQASRFVCKVPGGPLIRVHLAVERGRISDILLTGNMQPSRREMPEEMERALHQIPAGETGVEEALRKVWGEKKMEIAGARVEDFIGAVCGALKAIP